MKFIRELLNEGRGRGDYWLPSGLPSAKKDIKGWVEDWDEVEQYSVDPAELKKKLDVVAKEYMAYVKSYIKPHTDPYTDEEDVVVMREEGVKKVLKKHKLLGKYKK